MAVLAYVTCALRPKSQVLENDACTDLVPVTSEVVPVSTVLLCGEVECAKSINEEKVGSNDGIDGPNCVTMPPPELTPAPPAEDGAPLVLMLTPVKLTLVGPEATPLPTLRSAPPPW